MASFKVAATVLCVLLIGRQSLGVLNHGSSKNVNSDEEIKVSKDVEDRISNEYGVPPGPSFNGPAPVYGTPELVENHLQAQIFSPPTLQHGSVPRPSLSYGPSRNPPQLQFGPRPLKLAPWKLSPPPGRFGITKPAGHGPPIPISLEAYGPPNNLSPPSFSIQRPQNGYGPPSSFPVFPPIPQQPPPGVPAPPTPPDIKYDGWQPIAGHVEAPNLFPPVEQNHANVNLPSNSYGEPINNPDDHNLKQSVGPSDSDLGLPPPVLPEKEPLHNIQEPAKNFDSLPNTANAQTSSSSFSNELTSHINNQDDLSLQQLPPYPSSLPQVGDTYGAPPQSSFSANGPYPLSQGPFGTPDFNKHGSHRQQHSFNNFHHQRNQNSFRLHSSPGAFSPPRNRAPHKFREVVPGLLNSIHRYRPPGFVPPSGSYGRPGFGFTLKQQPPTSNTGVSFRPSTTGSFSFGNTNSLIAGPNANYGTPLTFSNFNTPAPVLNYGVPNFGSSNSFATVSSTINGNGRNLYEQQNIGTLSPAYGTPPQLPNLFTGKHECNQQHSVQSVPSSDESQFRQSQINSNEASSSLETGYQVPSINELELESNNADLHSDMKDSYGNPTGPIYDQRSSSSSSLLSGHSVEAVSALTAQSYTQQASDNLASTNELNIDQLTQLHGNNEPALALAQTLSAEGAAADGFQIQGSKGTYTLQIQSASGPQANENSDGTIRHDQLLSNGLLQDILAAIEEPGSGSAQLVSIQGSPQTQPLQEAFRQEEYKPSQDISQSDSSYASSEINNDSKATSIHEDNVALYFNNNGLTESNKEIRSTAKDESISGEESVKKNDSNSISQEEAPEAH